MSIRVTTYTIEVGQPQNLSIARGEDREYRLAFTHDGTAVDMTGATACVMTVRNRTTGIAVFARSYTGFQGAATAGTPRFTITQSDTVNQVEEPYDIDVTWTDASGYKEQLLVASEFSILDSVSETSDTVTTPPAVPVVYGINWTPSGYVPWWTAWSGGYHANDGVQAYDGSLGTTAISTFRSLASGVTSYPVNQSLLTPASGWAYIGQHGGGGSGGGGGASTMAALYAAGASSSDSTLALDSTRGPLTLSHATAGDWYDNFISGLDLVSANATSGATIKSSPAIRLAGSRWNAGAAERQEIHLFAEPDGEGTGTPTLSIAQKIGTADPDWFLDIYKDDTGKCVFQSSSIDIHAATVTFTGASRVDAPIFTYTGSDVSFGNGATTVKIAGGSAGGIHTVPNIVSNDTVALLAATQTLTNKTIAFGSNTCTGFPSGTVTSVSAGTGMSFTTITGIGTVSIDTTSVATSGNAITLSNKTLTAPVINGATSASGNFDLSGSSGTFKTTTGAVTIGNGAISITGVATFSASPTWGTDATYAFGDATHRATALYTQSINGGSVSANGTGATITTDVANGASSKGLVINNTTSLSTSGAKILDIQTAGTSRFYFSQVLQRIYGDSTNPFLGLSDAGGTNLGYSTHSIGVGSTIVGINFTVSNNNICYIDGTAVYPGLDNSYSSGKSSALWSHTYSTLYSSTVGSNLSSGTTIAPIKGIHHVTGTSAIDTITRPSGFTGTLTLIPDGIFTWTTSGNIALAGTAVVGKALHMTYDPGTSKWYPSYV